MAGSARNEYMKRRASAAFVAFAAVRAFAYDGSSSQSVASIFPDVPIVSTPPPLSNPFVV